MWSSKRGGGISGNPSDRSSWNHLGRDSANIDDRNDISSAEREIKFPLNNLLPVSHNLAMNHWSSGTTAGVSDWVFGQTEWSSLWAHKCFQAVAPADNLVETNPLPPISVPRNYYSESPLPRGSDQNQAGRVARRSCWDNGSDGEERVSIKSRLGNGGGPMRRLNDAKVRRDRSVPIYGQRRGTYSEAQNSQKEYGACRIRRSPSPPHVVPRQKSRGAVRPSVPRPEPEEPKEWEMRRHLRKLRFENNAAGPTDPVNMALDDLIAVKKNVKNSKKTSPLEKASLTGDLEMGDGIRQPSDRRSFNPKIEQPLNRPSEKAVHQIIKTSSSELGKMVIVDGPSVAFEYGDQIYFDWEGINVCVKHLMDFGCKYVKVVVPADKLEEGMTKNNHYADELQKKGILLPCRENQNYKQMMLNIACKKDAIIISNDAWKKTKDPGSGVSNDAAERTSRFSFKARGPSKTMEFAKFPNGSNELSLDKLI